MKKLSKIFTDKRIKDEELIKIKGGQIGSYHLQCCCASYGCTSWFTMLCDTWDECQDTFEIMCGNRDMLVCVNM